MAPLDDAARETSAAAAARSQHGSAQQPARPATTAACSSTDPHVHYHQHWGPKRWFNPTTIQFKDHDGQVSEWSSRRARKGRYQPTAVPIRGSDGELHHVKMRLRTLDSELKPHLIGDVTFWIAAFFWVGSAIWVGNGRLQRGAVLTTGFMAWYPFIRPEVANPDAIAYGACGIGVLGAILFEAGAYLMVVEALDRGRETNMGTSMWLLFERAKARAETSATGSSAYMNRDRQAEEKYLGANAAEEWPSEKKGFKWWGKPLWHDMGYVAALIMFVSASIFFIATVTAFPGVIAEMAEGEHYALGAIFFALPQVVGSVGFVTTSYILTVEVQHHWWLPRPTDIGWQSGFWNILGSVGFLLCGCLSFSHQHAVEYQTSLATFWGSCAFLIGATFQLWEVLWREPPDAPPKDDPKPAKKEMP